MLDTAGCIASRPSANLRKRHACSDRRRHLTSTWNSAVVQDFRSPERPQSREGNDEEHSLGIWHHIGDCVCALRLWREFREFQLSHGRLARACSQPRRDFEPRCPDRLSRCPAADGCAPWQRYISGRRATHPGWCFVGGRFQVDCRAWSIGRPWLLRRVHRE